MGNVSVSAFYTKPGNTVLPSTAMRDTGMFLELFILAAPMLVIFFLYVQRENKKEPSMMRLIVNKAKKDTQQMKNTIKN